MKLADRAWILILGWQQGVHRWQMH